MEINEILNSDNVAELLDEDQLTTIFNECNTGYMEDVSSRGEWNERQDTYMSLALQVVEQKNSPWVGASNVKYPLLTTATMQFGARAYPGLIPGPQIFKGRVSGFDTTGEKAKSAERIGKHMSYQVIEEMDDWEEDMDRLCVSIPIVGCMFKKTYYSPSRQKNVSELVYPKHLIVNYWAKSLKTAPRITHEVELSDNDVHERIASGIYLDQEYVKEVPKSQPAKEQAHGVRPGPEGTATPHLFKEQHTWLDLDDDGYKEPYIVTFGDSKVARIYPCFDVEGVKYNEKQEVVCIERIEYFTKYGFVPSPDGSFYDIGFGLLLGPINDSINTAINQLNDAGTMSNRAGGFLGRGAKIKGGRHAFKPFEWQNLQTSGDDLRKNVFPLPVREPSPVLFSLLGLLIEAGKELSSTVPMMLGQNPGQNQPATTSLAVIEQGLKVFSAIFKRLHRALKMEAKKLKRLNRIYLPPESYFQVLDPKVNRETGVAGEMERIFKLDYREDVTDVQLYSDPNIISEVQRMLKAQQIGELMAQRLIPNPKAGAKIILEAMDLPNIDELLTEPPQVNPELELNRMKVQGDVMYKMGKLKGELAVMDAQVSELQTRAMLNLAKAEAEQDNIQIKVYQTQLDELNERREGIQQLIDNSERMNESRNVQGMEGSGGNAGVSEVS